MAWFAPGAPARGRWVDPVVCAGVALLAVLVYAGSLRGGFVYDDNQQIVRNPSIQNPDLAWKALTSDVWAFRGERDESWSSYWRPTFVAWMILNHRVFGVEDGPDRSSAPGWRATTLALHAGAVGLCYVFARRLGLGVALASGAAAVFATHGTGPESAAWISGAPNMLVTIGLLGSWLAITPAAGRTGIGRWTLALALYAFALGSKELAALFPAVVFVSELSRRREEPVGWTGALTRAARVCLPFAALAAAYLVARHAVIGGLQKQTPGGATPVEALLTAPGVLCFYLRQTFWPASVGPIHPLAAVSGAGATWPAFWAPLACSAVALAGACWLGARSGAARVGLAFVAIALAPAFNITAFQPEELVHDRYLYPALPGIAVASAVLVAWACSRLGPAMKERAPVIAAGVFWACAAAMIPGALAGGRAWMDDRALWERAARMNPSSPAALARLGVFVAEKGEFARALELFDRSIAARRTKLAETARAGVLLRLGRDREGEAALRDALAAYGADFRIYERLCALLERQGRLEEGAATAREARAAMPWQCGYFTDRLAVALAKSGRVEEAIGELESAREAARAALDAPSKLVFLRLGLLYAQVGRSGEAREAFEAYLEQTSRFSDAITRRARRDVEAQLVALQAR